LNQFITNPFGKGGQTPSPDFFHIQQGYLNRSSNHFFFLSNTVGINQIIIKRPDKSSSTYSSYITN